MNPQLSRNDKIKQDFFSHFNEKRLPHALLFVGGTLAEKKTLAMAIVQKLLCDTQAACGSCAACQWINNYNHPDVLLLPEASAETIKIDDVRAIQTHLMQSAHQGKYKIIILAPAEAMPFAAMNALLKTLEEPPPQSIILLLTQYVDLLPATIRSRCQRYVLLPQAREPLSFVKPLSTTLMALINKDITVFKAAEQWQKHSLSEVLESLYQIIVEKIQQDSTASKTVAHLFPYYDTINQMREQLIRKANPNQLLTLENIFYQWTKAHVS